MRRGLRAAVPAQAPPRCTKCNSPPSNGQCTNFGLFDETLKLKLPLHSKGLTFSVLWVYNIPFISRLGIKTKRVSKELRYIAEDQSSQQYSKKNLQCVAQHGNPPRDWAIDGSLNNTVVFYLREIGPFWDRQTYTDRQTDPQHDAEGNSTTRVQLKAKLKYENNNVWKALYHGKEGEKMDTARLQCDAISCWSNRRAQLAVLYGELSVLDGCIEAVLEHVGVPANTFNVTNYSRRVECSFERHRNEGICAQHMPTRTSAIANRSRSASCQFFRSYTTDSRR